MKALIKVSSYLFFAIILFPLTLQATIVTDLFEEHPKQVAKGDFVEDAVFFSLNQEVLQRLYKADLPHIDLTIPFENGKALTLNLDQTKLVASDFKATIQTGNTASTFAYTLGNFYRGSIAGVKDAFVAINLYEDKLTGVLTVNNHNYNIGRYEKGGDNSFVLYREENLNFRNPFTCEADDPDFIITERPKSSSRSNSKKVVRVYVECDFQLYKNKGRSKSEVMDFTTGLFNVVTTFYAQESITIEISEIKIWTSQDPYVRTSGKNARIDFGNKLAGDFNGDIAHLLSNYLKNGVPPNGGSAYLDALCDKDKAVSYTNITTSYSSFPTFSWTAYAVTHEIGHNLGSPHTHSCVWPTGPIDNCWCPEGGCAAGPEPSSGTIMSYCHLDTKLAAGCSSSNSNPGISFAAGFGTQPGNLIRSNIEHAGCLHGGVTTSAPSITANLEVQDESCADSKDGKATVVVRNGQEPFTYIWSTGATTQSIDNQLPATYSVTVTDRNGKSAIATGTIQPGMGSSIKVDAGEDMALGCGNQEVQLDASASAKGFQYRVRWTKEGGDIGESTDGNVYQPILSVTEPGTYIYTIINEDTGCSASDKVIVTEETNTSSLQLNGGHLACNQSTTKLSANTDIEDGTYHWSGPKGFNSTESNPTVQEAGVYELTITSNSGCSATASIEVKEQSSLAVENIVIADEYCGNRDGSIQIEMKEVANYTVQWNTGHTGLHLPNVPAGNYSAILSNEEGCSTTIEATVEAASEIKLLTVNVQEISCYGANDGSMTIGVTGGKAPYQLLWSNGVEGASNTDLGPGTHSLEVEDAKGCTQTYHFTLENPDSLTVTTTVVGDEVSFDVAGGSSDYEYHWNNGWTSSSEVDLENGAYEVTIMDSNGCSIVEAFTVETTETTTNMVDEVVENTSAQEEGEETPLLYPNPADTYVRIYQEYGVEQEVYLTIFNNQGYTLHRESFQNTTVDVTVNTTTWENGTYHVQLLTKDGLTTEELKVVHN